MASLRDFLITLKFNADVTSATQQTNEYVRQNEQGAQRVSAAWDRTSAQVRGHAEVVGVASEALKEYFAIALAAAAPEKLIEYADAWTEVGNRIRQVTDTSADYSAAQTDVVRIALTTHQSLGATAELYERMAESTAGLGLSSEQTGRIVETMSKAIALSGGSSEEAQSAMRMLAAGMASGEIKGKALTTVFKQFPALAQAIAGGMGVSVNQLKALADAGRLTTANLVAALSKAADGVDASPSGSAGTCVIRPPRPPTPTDRPAACACSGAA